MSDKGIHVLMMGGRRAGKSSMLAGLFNVMLGSDISKLMKVKDVTSAGNTSLEAKVEELRQTLRHNYGRVILVDAEHTDKFRTYSLQFTIPGTQHSMSITFTDANGEYFFEQASYAREREELKRRIEQSDIILIAIDTVFLMNGTEGQNRLANCVGSIEGLLTELKLEDKAKLVVYAPIKCERWSRDGYKLEQVTQKVEKVYETSIKALSASPLVEILILPVQTVGNIVFKEMLPASVYNAGGQALRCSIIDDGERVRFADGTIKDANQLQVEHVVDDPLGVFQPTSVERPNSWFCVVGSNYAPKNCEQLAYHILRYMLDRAIDSEKANKKDEGKNSWVKWALAVAAVVSGMGWLYAAAATAFVFGDKAGNVSLKEMENLVGKLSSQGYIKDDGDGIKVVHRYEKL